MPRRGSTRTYRCPPDHKHGETTTCYGHGCGCDDCLTAHNALVRKRRKRVAYGRPSTLVDPTPALEKIAELRTDKWTWKQISDAVGMPRPSIQRIASGEPTKLRDTTVAAILAIDDRPAKSPMGRVDATGTRRRLQALNAVGWSWRLLGEALGVDVRNLWALEHSKGTCTESTRAAVTAFYDSAPPVPDGYIKTRSMLSAQRHGFAPPDAWWDIDIDDPNAEPADVTEDEPGWVVDELDHLHGLGESAAQAATAIGHTRSSLTQIARRHKRPDLARWVDDKHERKAA